MSMQQNLKYLKWTYIDMQINALLPEEKYEIYMKPNFNTAAWYCDNGVHKIVIGDKIHENMRPDEFSKKENLRYLGAYLTHELAHSIWTEKDIKSIAKILKEKRIDFNLFNLFEDARIEEKMRKHLQKNFHWAHYEEIFLIKNPVGMFFYILQNEHNKEILSEMQSTLDAQGLELLTKVFKFYKKVLNTQTTLHLIPILQAWYKEFPDTRNNIKDIIYLGHLFSEENKYKSKEEFDVLLEGTYNIITTQDVQLTLQEVESSKIKLEKAKASLLLHPSSVELGYSFKERDYLLSEMKKMFVDKERTLATHLPSKRLNLKRAVSCSDKLFKRKMAHKKEKKKANIILDLSGSMECAIEDMRLIIDVINTMVIEGYIEANLILTCAMYPYVTYEVLPMPLVSDTISRLVPKSASEGLHITLMSNLKLLKWADYNWILTDGFIDEGPLDKDYYAKQNIHTHAMYIGDVSVKQEMLKSFDYVLCEKDVRGLTQKIFLLFK
ncbi:hypothetical protein JHD49_09170 [Sulfurimonas sp. SAG-AH-194-C21]|nr:hypothetical protein [Sulfurimonas sp. SAG-AH-194-C21]MDF1884108.1 hypothetical protein [Sulfurimonas sp. SAG-AH-194-C21]